MKITEQTDRITCRLNTGLLLLICMIALGFFQPAKAANFSDVVVDSFSDIIAAVDTVSDGDVVNFHIKGDIAFSRAVQIKKGVATNLINDSGADKVTLTVDGGNYRHFLTSGIADNASMTVGAGVVLDGGGTGGGIVLYGSGCALTLDGCTITGCVNGGNGGGVLIQGNASRNTLLIKEATINGCRAGAGAGLFASDCDIVMNGGEIKGNSATSLGGGIQTMAGANKLGSTLTIDRGKISVNTATAGYSDGGGINAYDTVVTIRDSEISDNSADNYGGGIHLKTYTMSKNDSALIIRNSTIKGNRTRNTGGGIGIETELREFSLTNCLITENEAVSTTVAGTNQGGGIYFVGGSLTLSDGKITKNKAGKGGGGILASMGTLIVTGTAEISGNESDIVGGGIYGYMSPNVTIGGDARVTNNHAKCNGDPGRLYGGGGAVALYATNLIISGNAIISDNTALSYGGGIWTYPDYTPISTVTISGGTIDNNSANYGGGVSMGDIPGYVPSLTVTGGTITGNIASKDGGGIYVAGGVADASGALIGKNTAGRDGGGIWMYKLEALTTDGVTFTGNKAATGYIWDVNNPSGEVQAAAAAIHKSNIINTTYTAPFTNAYSNYDVNFTAGTPAVFYRVSYDANGADGGSVPVDAGDYLTGDIVTVKGNTGDLRESGHEFTGWSFNSNGSGTVHNEGGTFTIGNADVVLYAVWRGAGIPGPGEPETEFPEPEIPETQMPEPEIPEAGLPGAEIPETELPGAEIPGAKAPETEAITPPKTGDTGIISYLLAFAASSLLACCLIIKRRKI